MLLLTNGDQFINGLQIKAGKAGPNRHSELLCGAPSGQDPADGAVGTKKPAPVARGGLSSVSRNDGRLHAHLVAGVVDLAVGALLPDVHDVVRTGDVALLVEGEVADHRLEGLARVHVLGHLLRVGRLHRLGRLLVDLDRRVAVERVGLGLEVLLAELLDRRLGVRVLARVGREGHQRAFGAGTGDRDELRRHDAVAGHHRGVEALVAHLADDEPGLGVQPAEIDDVDVRLLQLRDEGRVVLLAGVDALVHDLLQALLVHRLLGLVGEALAVGGLVVDDGDLLALEALGEIAAGDLALLVVAAAGAEGVPLSALGQARVRRGGRRLDDAGFLVDLGGRDRDAGVEVADDPLDAFGGELVRDRDALLRIGHVVADRKHELLAHDAAGGVDVLDRLLGAVLELGPEGGVRAGDRSGDADLDLRVRRARESNTETERDAGQQHFLHLVTPLEILGFLTPATAGNPADRRNLAFFSTKVTPVLRAASRARSAARRARRASGTGSSSGLRGCSGSRPGQWREPQPRQRDSSAASAACRRTGRSGRSARRRRARTPQRRIARPGAR